MDLTSLFLGEALEGVDLGGLSKLGFNMAEGFDSDDAKRAKRHGDSDDSDKEASSSKQDSSDSEETKEAISMPPVLYANPGGRTVYELTSLFVPGQSEQD